MTSRQRSPIFFRVLAIVSKIPKGKVSTYKAVAKAAGTSPRAVGAILNKNDTNAPCHRVVMSDGSIGGYRWGVEKKVKKLDNEGVKVVGGRVKDFEVVTQ